MTKRNEKRQQWNGDTGSWKKNKGENKVKWKKTHMYIYISKDYKGLK